MVNTSGSPARPLHGNRLRLRKRSFTLSVGSDTRDGARLLTAAHETT
jgi:hypothetical protein